MQGLRHGALLPKRLALVEVLQGQIALQIKRMGAFPDRRKHGRTQRDHQGRRDGATGQEQALVAPSPFLELVNLAGRPGQDRFVTQIPRDILGQAVGRLVTA
jgi:hypothetical protein